MKKKSYKVLEYYMSLNYPFTVDLFEENGEIRFGLLIPELEGVWADGNTLEEAYINLIETKKLWFETCIENGMDIPEPISEKDFSGKFILRLNPRLHKDLSEKAHKNKISLNQYIRLLLEKQITNSDLVLEIKRLIETISKQSETIKELRKELTTLENRISSLEETFSSVAGFEPSMPIIATTEGYFRGTAVGGYLEVVNSDEAVKTFLITK